MLSFGLLALASVAAGLPGKSVKDYIRGLEDRDISTQQMDDFHFYAEHSGAAYCNYDTAAGSPVVCDDNVCPDVQTNGVTVVGSWEASDTGIGAYVATDPARGEVVLSVRGSNNIRNFITDVVFVKSDCSDLVAGCEVHKGFHDAWNELASETQAAIDSALAANPAYRLVLTGHSLGAAVATLGGAYLRQAGYTTDIWTYGSPRVGNDVFANFVTDQAGAEYRMTHLDDPVPRLPPILFDYAHTSPEYWLSDGEADTVNYSTSDVVVCEGIENTDCNAGTIIGLDIIAHLHYLLDISGCSEFPFQWKKRSLDERQEDISDDELATRLSGWAQDDIDYVA